MPRVHAVHRSATHSFSKPAASQIQLVAGMGVEGDAHSGATVKHRSRVARDPAAPNLRQVHLLQNELLIELEQRGFNVHPGAIGENITTSGLDLLALATDTELHIGPEAIVRVTGLRNPCTLLDTFETGLMRAVLDHRADGELVRRAGVMGVVVRSGRVKPGDTIVVRSPAYDHVPLRPV